MNTSPSVSIICLTYNQEQYVRDCFEGFVMQKTTFPFEVLVFDDASTDSTPLIIQEYADKYPEIFRPTLFKKNNFSQGLGYVGLYKGIQEATGNYVAYCEGDDYWTSPDKLQKQVDFLESHPNYEVCAHETLIRDDENNRNGGALFSDINKNLFISSKKGFYSFEDSLTGNIFHVSSMVYRNFRIKLPSWIATISAADMVLFMLLGEKGDTFVMPEVMSVYRGHSGSLTSSREEYFSSLNFYMLSIKIRNLMNDYWEGKYSDKLSPIIARYYVECAMIYLRHSTRNIGSFGKMLKTAYSWNKRVTIESCSIGLWHKLHSHICKFRKN